MTIYIETSAAAKLLVKERESAALRTYLDEQESQDEVFASSQLLETELRRLASRIELPQKAVTELLDRLHLLMPDRAIYTEAGLLPGADLRSLDALHIAVAVRIGAEAILSYDQRQSCAARAVGLPVLAPS